MSPVGTNLCCLALQVQALQQQHEQAMLNVRHSQGVELRRALRNQEVDLIMQHLKEKQGLVDESVLVTRDEALAELQHLKLAHRQLQAYVSLWLLAASLCGLLLFQSQVAFVLLRALLVMMSQYVQLQATYCVTAMLPRHHKCCCTK